MYVGLSKRETGRLQYESECKGLKINKIQQKKTLIETKYIKKVRIQIEMVVIRKQKEKLQIIEF